MGDDCSIKFQLNVTANSTSIDNLVQLSAPTIISNSESISQALISVSNTILASMKIDGFGTSDEKANAVFSEEKTSTGISQQAIDNTVSRQIFKNVY